MRKVKLFLTAVTVICALPECTGETEAPKDQTQAVSEAKTEEVEETGKEAGKSENAGETEETKKAKTPEDRDLFTYLISKVPAGVPFTDLTWTGSERIGNECGAQVKLIETLDKAKCSEQIRAMAEVGANPIYTMSDTVNEATVELAPEYPEAIFCLINNSLDTKYSSVMNVYVDSLEPAFVPGFMAAKTTRSGTIEWTGSLDIPVIDRFRDVYLAGAKYVNPDVVVQAAYVGDDSDTIKAGEQTRIMISQSVDVILRTASLTGLDVIQGYSDAGIECVGVDEWQGDIGSCVLWSSLTNINGAVFDSFAVCKEGGFTVGRISYGIETRSAVYDDRDYEKLPDDVKAELDGLLAVVKSGSLNLEDLLK